MKPMLMGFASCFESMRLRYRMLKRREGNVGVKDFLPFFITPPCTGLVLFLALFLIIMGKFIEKSWFR